MQPARTSSVEQMLVPTVQPGDVVIMDNLGSQRRQVTRRAIRAAGAKLLFLPAYSLDPGPQSDRAGLRQAQDPLAQAPLPDRRNHLALHRPTT